MSIKKIDYYNINGMGPAGSINSCANDMGNWISTWIMGGKFNESEIIPSSYVKDASSSQMVVRGGQPTDHSDIQFTNYGLGWFLESYRGHFLVEHGGNINGFSANVAFYPSDSIGIVVLTNQNGSEVPEIVRNFISDKLFALSPIPWNADAKKAKDEMMAEVKKLESKADTTSLQVKNTQPSHPLKDYAGYYSNDAYGNFTVVYENDTLKTFLAGEKMWMSHYHYDIFNLESVKKEDEEDESKFLLNFASASNGKIDRVSLDLDEPEKTTEFLRSTPKVELSNDDLTKYVGDYDLEGNTIKVYIKGKVLMVLVPGQPDYETASIGNDTFELTIAKGYSVKFTMENGKSKALVFQQPNGNFTAKRK